MINAPILQHLPNVYSYSDTLITSGQPAAEDFQLINDAGCQLVINLALPDSPGAIKNEDTLVRSAGCDYLHIPVDFKAPNKNNLEAFFTAMDANRDKSKLVHCAYNWRVSAFVFLYRVIKCNTATDEAMADLRNIWIPDSIWQTFISEMLADQLPGL
ncbi:MAG TPA: protein tyrosine phosphatase family protein [Gammaproteobacteria bacterium]